MVMSTRPAKWDIVDHLNTQEDVIGYLNACVNENDANLIVATLGDIARLRGMTQLGKDVGLSGKNLHHALSGNGHPKLSTIIQVIIALGLGYTPVASKHPQT
jgi:probable addiction module antidote protein